MTAETARVPRSLLLRAARSPHATRSPHAKSAPAKPFLLTRDRLEARRETRRKNLEHRASRA